MVDKVLFSHDSDEWQTPKGLYDQLNAEFEFMTDPCTTPDNPLGTKIFYTKEDNGLVQDWKGNTFINPPFSQTKEWVRQAYNIHYMRDKFEYVCGKIVMLLPARTDTKWFHMYVYQKRNIDIRFIKGRLRFGGAKNSAPFPSMIVIFR